MIAIVFGAVVPWLIVALAGWVGYQLVRQNGRILLRLDSIDQRLAGRRDVQPREPGGVAIGTLAPDFELPDLAGKWRKLSEFRGRELLLIFFNPQCGFCTKMAADLAALPADGAGGRPVPFVVTTGNVEQMRKLVEDYGIHCVVLLQEKMEVASLFGAQGTPMGYRIDREGRIASELATGADALFKLAEVASVALNDSNSSSNDSPNGHPRDYRSLAGSRLNRSGLKAGAEAPDFRLSRLDGGELSLSELRGGRVLLVFSDPHCGPCAELAPRLEEIHSRRSDLQVLVISRGDVEENRAKASELELNYPIVLQKHWEISLKYAMFATPIAYLIDEQGILASEVAVGVGPILALAGESSDRFAVPAGASAGKERAWAKGE